MWSMTIIADISWIAAMKSINESALVLTSVEEEEPLCPLADAVACRVDGALRVLR